ncbi:hypothetical protein [Silvibacterium dinghuense]|uniref:Uncharacterized protein n=1 Tax=Silvibacterium dinghuense TaxID=1560006 RepID=A0A4Q1SKF2_9BACT|nr:hypothetical protein [Silvibacterium dinghuense]RXS97945.1 hypothetical protein ESZ00_08855 [Silvibacterium dinghuense]GGH03239.1 hypothetical protein GCM10011586_18950 [Silvibacterium dinghuense]
MDDQKKRGFENFGRKVDEKVNDALPRIEEELKRIIAYLNDEVVPDVRRNSLKAMRIASEKLSALADRWEQGHGNPQGGTR